MDRDIKEVTYSRRKKHRVRKGRIAIAIVIISIFIAGAAYAFLGGAAEPVSAPADMSAPVAMKGKINILVLGADTREDDRGRSDTIVVVTIDTIEKKIAALSIPRDSRVKIDGHGWDKINHAYAYGGSKLTKSSVEELLKIPVDYTVVMNFQGFAGLIDALGGVVIDVDKRMSYSDPNDDNGGLYIDLQPGVQRLNGKTAIEYVRYRDEEGDIGRVNRQQKFLKALLQEFTKPQIIAKLPDLIKKFTAAVKTDMPAQEMAALIPVINDAAKSGLHTEWVSGTPCWIHEISYWLPDIKELRDKVARIQGIAIDARYTQETEQLVKEYAKAVPHEKKEKQTSDTIKKLSNNTDKAQNVKLTHDKSKSENRAEKEEIISDPPINKVITKQKGKGKADGAGEFHKTVITDINDSDGI